MTRPYSFLSPDKLRRLSSAVASDFVLRDQFSLAPPDASGQELVDLLADYFEEQSQPELPVCTVQNEPQLVIEQ